MSDEKINTVANARMAQLAYSFFKEELDKEQNLILNSLKRMARDSKHDLNEYAGGLIAMNRLEDLEKRLLKQITVGEKIEKDMNNGINK